MTERTDYGVGQGGVALPSNPAFEAGGIPVTMDDIVRAETAKYLCEETARTGPNVVAVARFATPGVHGTR